jgi:histidinol-phosphate aminotransferase
MKSPLRPLGITQGVAFAALTGPEELARRAGLPGLVRLGSNESPFGPSPRTLDAMRAAAGEANRYGDPSNALLRGAVAAHHGVAPEHIAVAAGIDDLLGLAVRAFLTPGGPAMAALGSFPTFEMHARGYGAHLTLVPYLPEARLDLAGLTAAVEAAGGGLVFLPNPDNPSGTAYPWEAVVQFAQGLPAGALVIHDEAYANFLPRAERFPSDAIDPRILRMRTFSKEYGLAGLRVGYALGSLEAIAALDAVRLLYGVNRIAQAAALAALGDADYMESVVERTAQGRADYVDLGKRLGIRTVPSQTNFVLFDVGDAARADRVVRGLRERGIHVRKPPSPPLDGTVRVSVGTQTERALLAGALERILCGEGPRRGER